MSFGFILATFTAALALSTSLSGQRTWVVDDTMAAGAHFSGLIAAHAAASNGDRIQIRYGSGAGYASPVAFDKGVRICGLGSPKPTILYSDAPIRCPPGELLMLDSLEMRGVGPSRIPTGVENSLGLVVLSNLDYPPPLLEAVYSWRSRRVVFVNIAIAGAGGALGVYDSRVWLLNCRTSVPSAGDPIWDGSIELSDNSFLAIVGGRHEGGSGLAPCLPLFCGYSGEPAIWVLGSALVVSGPASLLGGYAQLPHPTCGGGSTTIRGRSIVGNCTQPRVIDPLASMNGPGINPLCAMNFLHEMPAVIPGPAVRGQVQNIDAYGPTSSIVSVFASFLTPYDPIVLPVGDVWLDPRLTVHIGSGAGLNAGRRITFTTTIPAWLTALPAASRS